MNETRTVTRYPTSGQRDQAHGYDADIEWCDRALRAMSAEGEGAASGYATSNVETLCGPCYFALWGPRGAVSNLAVHRAAQARYAPAPAKQDALDPRADRRAGPAGGASPPPPAAAGSLSPPSREVTGLHTVYQP